MMRSKGRCVDILGFDALLRSLKNQQHECFDLRKLPANIGKGPSIIYSKFLPGKYIFPGSQTTIFVTSI